MSDAEPELGLGLIMRIEGRAVDVVYPSGGEQRRYAIGSAPIRRVRFGPGDQIALQDGPSFRVETVTEAEGILIYAGEGHEGPESRLSDLAVTDEPERRLLDGRAEPFDLYELRTQIREVRAEWLRCPVRGFVGARMQLVPHQLYVASEVASRYAPRVLLADEVGLGKTIESCLILSRLLATGRAKRALILVPESLAHQWLVELLRRFNLQASLFDEARCAAIEEANEGDNPFSDDQLILASQDLLGSSEHRARQAAEAGWDVVIVDEAHRLDWKDGQPGPLYRAIARVAAASEGLLLLTATPEQLGVDGHFARLRLLDPERYVDFDEYCQQAAGYEDVARIAMAVESGAPLDEAAKAELGERVGAKAVSALVAANEAAAQDPMAATAARAKMLATLVDRHGTGRVMFRNTRVAVGGFPERRAHLIPLEIERSRSEVVAALAREVAADIAADTVVNKAEATEDHSASPDPAGGDAPVHPHDPRIKWLVGFIREQPKRKTLVICSNPTKARSIAELLKSSARIDSALFHEDATVIQRDRNAAWFADPDGVSVLVCSEIGSEGRNFQFAHDLVCFDVPRSPDLLEQRIGRLDRIGQSEDVQVHIPFVSSSGYGLLARWHHEGIDGIERRAPNAAPFLDALGDRLEAMILACAQATPPSEDEIADLLADTRTLRTQIAARIEAGRDRLLELASMRTEPAAQAVEAVGEHQDPHSVEPLVTRVLEHFGVYAEELDPGIHLLNPEEMSVDALPRLDQKRMSVTYDRSIALAREDVAFLTWDHPLVEDCLELFLTSPSGTAAFSAVPSDDPPKLMAEFRFVVECVTPVVGTDRFFPPTVVHVAVDSNGREVAEEFSEMTTKAPPDGDAQWPATSRLRLGPIFERMAETAHELGAERAKRLTMQAIDEVKSALEGERDRLAALAEVNDSVRPDELELLGEERDAIADAIASARLRTDAVHLVWVGSVENGKPAL